MSETEAQRQLATVPLEDAQQAGMSGEGGESLLLIACGPEKFEACSSSMWVFPKIMGKHPKSSILIGFSVVNHPFWGNPPILGKIHVCNDTAFLGFG